MEQNSNTLLALKEGSLDVTARSPQQSISGKHNDLHGNHSSGTPLALNLATNIPQDHLFHLQLHIFFITQILSPASITSLYFYHFKRLQSTPQIYRASSTSINTSLDMSSAPAGEQQFTRSLHVNVLLTTLTRSRCCRRREGPGSSQGPRVRCQT